ncbi:alpha-hydroxy acid oxidase [Luedemannella flava]
MTPVQADSIEEFRCVADLERAAAAALPVDIWDFVAGGSGAELTLAANRDALNRVQLVPRLLRDVSRCTTDTVLLGQPARAPMAIAPIAYQRLVHPDGELAAARAARDAGVPFIASTLSSVSIEELAAVGGNLWFQLYWLRDTGHTMDLVRRAEEAGCTGIVLTVDVPWMGRRLRDVRNAFGLPEDVRAANFGELSTAHQRRSSQSAVAVHTSEAFSSAVTWASVDLLRARTALPLALKGILAPEDARQAVGAGVDAIVVSNHGGRQLDGAIPSIDALPAVVAAVDGAVEVLMDSGIRTGTDILKALALGASGVLIGRPLMWGLAMGGQAGAEQVLRLLAEELRDALGLAGCDSVAAAPSVNGARPGRPPAGARPPRTTP